VGSDTAGKSASGKAVISRTAGIIEQLRTVRRAFSRALRANPVPRIDRVGERVRQEERHKRVVKVREGAEETGIGTETREEGKRERERGMSYEGVGAIKKFDYLATSHVELTAAPFALGDQPIVRPCYRALLQSRLLLLLSVVSGLA